MQTLKKVLMILFCFVLTFMSLSPVVSVSSVEAAPKMNDVNTTDTKYTAIAWAVDNNLLKVTNGYFNPKRNITDANLAEMVARLDKNYTFSYTPDMIYNFYNEFYIPFKAINDSKSRGSSITRAQFARIYAAFQGLDLSNQQAVQYMYVNEISSGMNGVRTYASYQPDKQLTREDAAVFLYRIAKKGQLAVVGLTKPAAGRDNAKITLPAGFNGNTTIEFDDPANSGNDVVGPDNVNNPLQSIDVEKSQLIANGVDSTLVQVQFKACKGQAINNDVSHAFEVKSKNNVVKIAGDTAKPAGTIVNAAGEVSNIINTDGSTLTFRVVAPKLSKSLKDTILIKINNNTDSNMDCFKGKTIEVPLTYVPQPEMRIEYEVFDSDYPDELQTDQKPEYPPYAEVPLYFTNNKVTVHDPLDDQAKTFKISQWTTYVDSLGQSQTGTLTYDEMEYQYASLKANGYKISLWLFETILQAQLTDSLYGEVLIDYELNSAGQPEYNLILDDDLIASQVENQNPIITIIKLLSYLPDEKNLTLEHYDSVKSIMAIYDDLSLYNNNLFTLYNSGKTAGALKGMNEKVDTLKESEDLASRPSDMKKYTKVIVSLVLPGGQVITDYDGKVKISYDGKEQIAGFVTNTSNYLNDTGHAGSAVAYFDSVIYGDSVVTAEIVQEDKDYSSMLSKILNKEHEATVYTDYHFTQNSCTNNAEVAFVLDYSSSMEAVDPENWRGQKTMSMIKQLDLEHVIQAKFDTKGTVLQTGAYKKFNNELSYSKVKDTGATNLVTGVNQVFNKFSGDVNATKTIVLVSDGKSSQTQLEQMLLKAKQEKVKIYTVGIGKDSQINKTLLAKIAKQTGGQFFQALDKAQLHAAYQTIIDSVLCGKVYSSCLNNPTLFNNARVIIRNKNVTMTTHINTNCTDVARVAVRYSSTSGDVQYDLTKKNSTLFSKVKKVAQLEDFDLAEEVQFLAYNKAGELLSTKTVKVSN